MNTNNFTFVAPGKRLDIVATARATFRVSVDKKPVCEIDFEVLYDMLRQCATDSRCSRPGFRRRKAEFLTTPEPPM